MRTSLLELQQIEAYLEQTTPTSDALLFEARLLLHPDLAQNMAWQQKSVAIIKHYGRRQLQAEVAAAGTIMFSLPEHEGFRQKIRRIFFKK